MESSLSTTDMSMTFCTSKQMGQSTRKLLDNEQTGYQPYLEGQYRNIVKLLFSFSLEIHRRELFLQ